MCADLFQYSPHESEDSGAASEEEEEEDEDEETDEDVESGYRHQGRGAAAGGVDGGGGGTGGGRKREFTEMKEQMYQDRLASLKRQLKELNEGSLPEYAKKLKRQEGIYKERMRICNVIRELEIDMVEQDFVNEKRSAAREFEEQKVFLRDQLIHELEEKQRMIETERHNMELTGDNMDVKPVSKRNLRRRVHDAGVSGSGYEKRGRGGNGGPGGPGKGPATLSTLNYLLDDGEVNDDLKIINKNRNLKSISGSGSGGSRGNSGTVQQQQPAPVPANTPASGSASASSGSHYRDTRIEEGKLFYEKRWFRRGQTVQVESKSDKFEAMISAIEAEGIWVRKSSDNSKSRIQLTHLMKGKYILKRRAA